MHTIYLTNYSVKGIKTLNQLVSLSFYKKIISNSMNTQEYNIKGIYGMNGSGKSGIITSVNIFRNLLIDPQYLNNPIVQKNLDAIVNKKTEELFIAAEFIVKTENMLHLFRYEVTLTKETNGRYIISHEKLSTKKATSQTNVEIIIFEIQNGEIIDTPSKNLDAFVDIAYQKTANLLSSATITASLHKIAVDYAVEKEKCSSIFVAGILQLWQLGTMLYVYLDDSDDHREYFVYNLNYLSSLNSKEIENKELLQSLVELQYKPFPFISISGNCIHKRLYKVFENNAQKLCDFIRIFKPDLEKIEIDKKEDHEFYICDLIMVYDSYKVHAEFESTGIKKLIKLFAYLQRMVEGAIVFIDEFDSNLHDVYLCALLEYLMEHGKGQLCFTTHNVGPMDVLKRHKKSIDFLSIDHKIYPWTTNGNYSPSKLYKNGMIEGSPFNVDSTDFVGVFGM